MSGRTTPVASARSALSFTALTGSSIAAHDAAPWVTDFLNAAYYRRPQDERVVDDLRLAFSILTTCWWRKGRRLHVTDLPAFHRAFGRDRLSAQGRLNREALCAGADRLLGDWFSDAYLDDARRGWGIAFPTAEERDAHDPERRLGLARVGELTPERAPAGEQLWHTYDPVPMPPAAAVIDVLTRPETWPDFATEIGRFTPLRPGGLLGQTFEIEVAAGTESGLPVFIRGYVTVTALATPDDAPWWDDLAMGLAAHGEPPALPDGASPRLGFDLTTHQGHFMGAGHNRLFLFDDVDGRTWARAAGTWDPMPWHVDRAYRASGQAAQHAFWTGEQPEKSLFCQLAARA